MDLRARDVTVMGEDGELHTQRVSPVQELSQATAVAMAALLDGGAARPHPLKYAGTTIAGVLLTPIAAAVLGRAIEFAVGLVGRRRPEPAPSEGESKGAPSLVRVEGAR